MFISHGAAAARRACPVGYDYCLPWPAYAGAGRNVAANAWK